MKLLNLKIVIIYSFYIIHLFEGMKVNANSIYLKKIINKDWDIRKCSKLMQETIKNAFCTDLFYVQFSVLIWLHLRFFVQ